MSVINSLTLDHFYITLPPDKFEKIKPAMEFLGGIYQHVKTPNDDWHGVYLFSRIRDNFEVLRERRTGGIGIALSALNPIAVNVRKILEEQPEHPWKTGPIKTAKDEPWFDWYSLDDYPNIEKTKFNVWIMDYHKRHSDYVYPLIPKPTDCFIFLEVTAGLHLKETIKKNLAFKDFKILETDNKMQIEFQRRDAMPFHLIVYFNNTTENFTPMRLKSRRFSDVDLDLAELKKFEFITLQNNEFTFDFTKL